MDFRSLLFRELRLSRKSIILQITLLLLMVALTWVMMFSIIENDPNDGELQLIIDTVIIAAAFVGAMYLMIDETFKSDINSGWLNYSYALPIRPSLRAEARSVRRISVCLVSSLISVCNSAAICAFRGIQFGANYGVWHILIPAAAFLFSLPDDLFVLRTRNAAELKKAQTTAGLTTTVLIAALIIVILNVSGIDLKKVAADESVIILPKFTAGAFAWTVPLLLVMIAADFFAAYFSLRSAYSGSSKTEKNAERGSALIIPNKTDGATGLLYKELKQNRTVIILTAAAPILLTAFPFLFSAIAVTAGETSVDEMFELTTGMIIRVLMFIPGIFIVSGLMSELFRGDDKKLWAYFVAAAPQGVKGFMYRKYVITLMINIIYMAAGIFADNLLATVNYFVTGEELSFGLSSLYLLGVFLIMLISAFDIPFTVRFGSKKGSLLKMIIMLLISIAGVVIFSLLPDEFAANIAEAVISFFKGEYANDAITLISGLFPYFSLAAYLLSYKISCAVFLKGVSEYDK